MPEGQTALRMRDVIEKWSHAAGDVATRRFDLDDVGPQVTHQLTAELALFVGQL